MGMMPRVNYTVTSRSGRQCRLPRGHVAQWNQAPTAAAARRSCWRRMRSSTARCCSRRCIRGGVRRSQTDATSSLGWESNLLTGA